MLRDAVWENDDVDGWIHQSQMQGPHQLHPSRWSILVAPVRQTSSLFSAPGFKEVESRGICYGVLPWFSGIRRTSRPVSHSFQVCC